MSISFVGSLPVSAVNVGLNASLGALDVEIAQLTVDLSGLAPALAGQLQMALNIPNLPVLAANVGASLNPISAALEMSPGGVTLQGVELALDGALELGLIEAKLAAVLAISVPIEGALAVGGIAGWSYAGSAAGFGERLRAATAGGFGRTAAMDTIGATIIATESPAAWVGLGSGFRTGPSSDGLHYLGQLGASEWSFGLGSLMARIRLFIAELEGIKASLLAQLRVMAGLDLPDIDATLSVGANVFADLGIDGLVDNLINVDVGIEASIGNIQAKIDALVSLKLELAASLSAGGLAVWTYSGQASLLGEALASEISGGVPGGNGPAATINGLVVAASPASMGTFGAVFLAA
jgi:hypothetical protein